MKYTVTIAGTSIAVEVLGDTVVVDGKRRAAVLEAIPHTPVRHLVLDGRSHELALTRQEEGWTVGLAGDVWSAEVLDERTQALREMTGAGKRHSVGGTVKAPMPGLVLRLEVGVGDRVHQGQGLVVLEAMKMENEIKAVGAGVVRAIHVAAGQAVDKGAPLLDLASAE